MQPHLIWRCLMQFTCHLFPKISITMSSALNPLSFSSFPTPIICPSCKHLTILVFPDFHADDGFLLGSFLPPPTKGHSAVSSSCVFWNSVPSLVSSQIAATFTPVQMLCLLPFLWEPLYPLLRRLAFETLCSRVSSHPPLPYLRASGWHFVTGIIYSHSLALKTFVPAAQLPDEGKRWVMAGLSQNDHMQ